MEKIISPDLRPLKSVIGWLARAEGEGEFYDHDSHRSYVHFFLDSVAPACLAGSRFAKASFRPGLKNLDRKDGHVFAPRINLLLVTNRNPPFTKAFWLSSVRRSVYTATTFRSLHLSRVFAPPSFGNVAIRTIRAIDEEEEEITLQCPSSGKQSMCMHEERKKRWSGQSVPACACACGRPALAQLLVLSFQQ